MAQQQVDLCQHNQTGFCKFRDKCPKRHENTVCENTDHCSAEKCNKRHPQICRNFDYNGKCRHKEQCAYKHIHRVKQTDLNEQIKQGLLKHERDLKLLTEEINTLKNLVQYMALELAKNIQKEVTVDKTNERDTSQEQTEIEAPDNEAEFKCAKCEFRCDKLHTLNTHMKTNHMHYSDKGNKYGNEHNFHCDKCNLGFTKKKRT